MSNHRVPLGWRDSAVPMHHKSYSPYPAKSSLYKGKYPLSPLGHLTRDDDGRLTAESLKTLEENMNNFWIEQEIEDPEWIAVYDEEEDGLLFYEFKNNGLN